MVTTKAATQRSSQKNMVLGKFILLKVKDFFGSPISAMLHGALNSKKPK
jgi:hypothetical protein